LYFRPFTRLRFVDAVDKGRSFAAVKILSAHATRLNQDGLLNEIEIMNRIPTFQWPMDGALRLPRILDHFEMDGPHGRHICLVLPVMSTDVGKFQQTAPSKALSIPQVKCIIAQIVHALEALHANYVVHTGKQRHEYRHRR
jgi:serine/threonine-protein kinase SRPK3